MKEFENFLTHLKEKELTHNTIRMYTSNIKQFIEYANIKTKRSINKELLMHYKTYLTSKFKPASINKKIEHVNMFLHYLQLDFKISPVLQEKRNVLDELITKAEYERLLKYAEANNKLKIKAILQTLAMTGIRINELQHFTTEALKKKYVIVTNKGKIREIVISESLYKILSNYMKKNHIKGIIFKGKSGNAIDVTYIHRELKIIAGKARVKKSKVHAHAFRHLFALEYLKKNNDMVALANILGHSSLETTRIYTQMTKDDYRKTMDIF